MKNRFQVTNWYTDVLSQNVSLVPANTGTTNIPVTTPPNLAIGKYFHIILKPTSLTKRLVLRCWIDTGNIVKVNNREILTSVTYLQNDQIAIFDVAELFNEGYHHIDDFGYVDKKYSGLDVLVRWGQLLFGGIIPFTVADTVLTMTNNTTNYIYFDPTGTPAFKSSVTIPGYPAVSIVVTAAGSITSVTDVRPYNMSNGDIVWPSSSINNDIPLFDWVTGKLLKDSGKQFSSDGGLTADSNAFVPTQRAVKTYADTKIPLSYLQTIVNAPWSNTKVPTEKAIVDFFATLPPWPAGPSGPAGQGVVTVDLIFDDSMDRLQDIATTATQIDWETIVDWDLVYVKNSSDALEIWDIYLATVVGINITWTFHSTPIPGSFIYSITGTVYGNTIITNGTSTVLWISKLVDLTDVDMPVLTDQYIIYRDTATSKFKLKASPPDRVPWIDSIGNNYLILPWSMTWTPPEVDIIDTRITDTTPYLVFFATQPVGTITKTLTNGNLNIASDNNSDTLAVKVLFRNIGPARNYMKWHIALTGAWPWTVTDSRITATTPATIMPRTSPVWWITADTWAGVMTIHSTGTEVGVVLDYQITLDTTSISDWMPYNATLDDDDMFFRKWAVSGDDEAVKWSDMKDEIQLWNMPAWSNESQLTVNKASPWTSYSAVLHFPTGGFISGIYIFDEANTAVTIQTSPDNSNWTDIFTPTSHPTSWTIVSIPVQAGLYVRLRAVNTSGTMCQARTNIIFRY